MCCASACTTVVRSLPKALGADGYRLDAVKHIEDAWLTDLRARLDGEVEWDQPFYLVGETYTGDRDLIKAYVNPQTMLDGQFAIRVAHTNHRTRREDFDLFVREVIRLGAALAP